MRTPLGCAGAPLFLATVCAAKIFGTAEQGELSGGEEAAKHVFALLVLLLTLAVSVRLYTGNTDAEWRETYVFCVLALMVVAQWYGIGLASIKVPAERDWVLDMMRSDCLASAKGGKMPRGDSDFAFHGACHCQQEGTQCEDATTGKIFGRVEGGTRVGTCPIGSACRVAGVNGTHGELITASASIRHYERDCELTQGPSCTLDQPCTPCRLEGLASFGAPSCGLCSQTNNGDCHFVDGVGPYCWAEDDYSRSAPSRVEPCKKCCTEQGTPELCAA